jgi:FkbM family methyltransferase
VPSLSELPLIFPLHRLAISLIRAMGGSEWLFDIYRRAWMKSGRNQLARTKFGAEMHCDLRDLIPSMIFHFGLWEPDISHCISCHLSEGDVFVDVGANLGYYSLLASKIVGRTGAVIAIEASPRIFARLQRNLDRNQSANIRVVNVAVSGEAGRAIVYAGPAQNSGATSILKEWRNGEAEAIVTALPLDQILTESERRRIALIKVDVEGAEAPILSRFISSLECYSPKTAIITEYSGGKETAINSIFSEFIAKGFSAYSISNHYDPAWYLNWRRPTKMQRLDACPSGVTDILFIREKAAHGVVEGGNIPPARGPAQLKSVRRVESGAQGDNLSASSRATN